MRKMRFGIAIAAVSLSATLVGCVPQPTACSATIEFDTAKYCAAGSLPIVGSNGATQETTIGGNVFTETSTVSLVFSASFRANTHGMGGVAFQFTESSTGAFDGFGIGEYTLGGDADHSLSFRYDGQPLPTGPDVLTATSGWLRITKLELAPSTNPDRVEITRLSATFEVDTEHGRLAGAVSIGHD